MNIFKDLITVSNCPGNFRSSGNDLEYLFDPRNFLEIEICPGNGLKPFCKCV